MKLDADLTTPMSEALGGFGGFLRCRTCGGTAPLGNPGVRVTRTGWPKCCGHTMEWITQRQINEGYLTDPEAWIAKEKGRSLRSP